MGNNYQKSPGRGSILFSFLLLCVTGVFQPRIILFHTTPPAMSITHTVLFQIKADAKPEDVQAACDRFIALKDKCIHPMTNTPCIASLKGGQDNSPEGLQNGITHGFVVEFNSAEDRDFYVKTDPAHQAFIKSIRLFYFFFLIYFFLFLLL